VPGPALQLQPSPPPQVGPKASAAAVLLSLAPCLAALWRRPGSAAAALAPAVVYANLCGFVWGYHVHEKAVITATVPLALLAVESRAWAEDFLLLISAGHAGLFPLLLGWAEAPVKWLVVGLYFWVAAEGLGRLHGGGGGGGKGGGGKGGGGGGGGKGGGGGSGSGGDGRGEAGGRGKGAAWLPAAARLYMAGLVPLEAYCALGHTALLGARLPFVPLMLTSVYCAVGVLWAWGRMARWYLAGCPARD
jgi:alpha-1,3-glucosyltransferase